MVDAVEHHVADKVRGGSEDWWETKSPHHGNSMRDSANRKISAKIEDDFNMLEGVRGAPASKPSEEAAATPPVPKVTPEVIHPYLRRTCPACFGGERPNLKTSR
ncbi:MAG TPA: hypothetical protein VGO47_14260 [Chlamydiales bacterium]|nr:hypothetical protein [Chlamydiales bacterium]